MFVCMRLVSFHFFSILVLKGLVRRLKGVKQQKLIWSYMALNTRKGIENEIEKFSCGNRFPGDKLYFCDSSSKPFSFAVCFATCVFEESNEWGALKIMIALEVFIQGKVRLSESFWSTSNSGSSSTPAMFFSSSPSAMLLCAARCLELQHRVLLAVTRSNGFKLSTRQLSCLLCEIQFQWCNNYVIL